MSEYIVGVDQFVSECELVSEGECICLFHLCRLE